MDYYKNLKGIQLYKNQYIIPDAQIDPYSIYNNIIIVSGHFPKVSGNLVTGKLGDDMDTKEGIKMARLAGVEVLMTLHEALGDLNRIKKIINVLCMVNGTQHFTESHLVANGCSALLHEVFGEAGRHARNACTVSQLPLGACLEIGLQAEFA